MSRTHKGLALALSFLLLVAIDSTAFGSAFKASGNYAVGNHPVAIAAGDFSGDGKVDLAVANRASKTVSVLLGNGDGTFGKAADYAIGVVPGQLVITDFKGDGRADIVVGDAGGTKISVLLGSGDGGFEAHVEMGAQHAPPELVRLRTQAAYRSGTQAASAVFADFNGDGQVDEAVSLPGRNLVSVLLNVTEESNGSIDLIGNGGFETGTLAPWFQGRDFCSAPCKQWAVIPKDPWEGNFDAADQGNFELRQNFAATATSSITGVTFWLRHPEGAIGAAFDLFYTDGSDEEYVVDTSNGYWESFDVTSDLAPGKSLEGFSIWGFSGGIGSPLTFVDSVAIDASN